MLLNEIVRSYNNMIQIMMLIIGILMIFAPKTILKTEYKADINRIHKMKRNGIYFTIAVVAWISFSFLKDYFI